MKKEALFLFSGLIVAQGIAIGMSGPSSSNQHYDPLLKLTGAVILTVGGIWLAKSSTNMVQSSEIHREAAVTLGKEWVKAKAQELPQAACLDSQGIPSQGFETWAMKLMPGNHQYYKEIELRQFDGTMGILGSVACSLCASALIVGFTKR